MKKKKNPEKDPTIPLKEVPLDVRKYMLKVQGENKVRKGVSQYSLCLTVFQIIREHREFMKDRQKTSSL